MKQFFLTLLFFSAGLICFHPRYDLKAECYGDAAAMYGCGVTPQHQTRGGSLQEFGVGKKPVLPYISYQGNYNDDFITVEESRRMMKSIILNGNRANDTSQAAFRAAIGNTGRSIRRSGGSTSRTSGSFFGGGSRRF